MGECFVIMPLTTPPAMVERYGGDPHHFTHVLDHLFVPAIEQAGFTPKKPIAEGADLIHAEIVRNLETADLVLCDISALNANVFFEFGIRTALDHPICLIRDEHTELPFDVSGINCHQYSSSPVWELNAEIDRLAKHLKAAAERANGHNALWERFGLTQRGEDAINAAPGDAQTAAMKLILDEIQRVRRDLPPVTDDTGWRSFDAVSDVMKMLARHRIGWVAASQKDGQLQIQPTDPWPSRKAQEEVANYAAERGVGLRFSAEPQRP